MAACWRRNRSTHPKRTSTTRDDLGGAQVAGALYQCSTARTSNGTRTYVYGATGLAYTVNLSSGAVEVAHADGLGSVRALTDGSGTLLQTYRTDTWGVPTATQGSSTQPFGFTGEQTDGTGLVYLRARMYDPQTGRFLQRDTVAKAGPGVSGWNRYTYVGNNPVNATDPSGNLPPVEYGPGILINTGSLDGPGVAINTGVGDLPEQMINTGPAEDPTVLIFNGPILGPGVLINTGPSDRPSYLPSYTPAPKNLPAFPDARPIKRKTPVQGGGGLRKRWKDTDGSIYEWDSQHGLVEGYDSRGRHIGEFDPNTGEQTKPADSTRRVEP